MRKYMFATGFGIGPFVYLAREKNNKWWVLPSIGVLIAGKYIMDREMNTKLKENNVSDYFVQQS